MELAKMEESIRKTEIKGQKLYNICQFEKAKKVWTKKYDMVKKVKALKLKLQTRK